MKIIDFHTHPILKPKHNILMYKDSFDFTVENYKEYLTCAGVSKICGSVINPVDKPENRWQVVKDNNDAAYKLKEIYGDFYIPGIHIHPDFVDESIAEIERAEKNGVRLIGELVPYIDGWDYDNKGLNILFDIIARKEMVVSIHSTDSEKMDRLIERHPKLTIVGAHPCDWNFFFKQLERLKKYDNYMLDISAEGITRFGMLKKLVDEAGSERIVYGSDYPSCDPIVFISAVIKNPFISDKEKENILFLNAERILKTT